MPEREPFMPEYERRALPIFPDERSECDFPVEEMRVVGFVMVDVNTKQLREGTVCGATDDLITVRFDTKLPAVRYSDGRNGVNQYERTFRLDDAGLMRRIDYNLLRRDDEHINQWLERSQMLGGQREKRYLKSKLAGPGIERVVMPYCSTGNRDSRRSTSYRGLRTSTD